MNKSTTCRTVVIRKWCRLGNKKILHFCQESLLQTTDDLTCSRPVSSSWISTTTFLVTQNQGPKGQRGRGVKKEEWEWAIKWCRQAFSWFSWDCRPCERPSGLRLCSWRRMFSIRTSLTHIRPSVTGRVSIGGLKKKNAKENLIFKNVLFARFRWFFWWEEA